MVGEMWGVNRCGERYGVSVVGVEKCVGVSGSVRIGGGRCGERSERV